MSELRWQQPGTVAADFWRVYRDGSLLVDGVLATPDSEGVRTTPLPGHPTAADYTMTAVNEHGESPPSNVIPLPEPNAFGMLGSLLLLLVVLHLGGRWRR